MAAFLFANTIEGRSMKVTLTKEFRCAPLGHTVETFAAGTEVDGQVAEWAITAGHAKEEPTKPIGKKMAKKLENK